MRRMDAGRRIDFIDVSEEGSLCPIDRKTRLARLHASEDGVLLSGAAAFAAMWRAIPLLRPLGLANVNAEFSLTTLAYNLRRAINILSVPALLRAVRP